MAFRYLRPIGDERYYSDFSDWEQEPFQREGFEWVLGKPPESAIYYQDRPTLAQNLEKDFIEAIKIVSGMDPMPLSSMELQGMYALKASVTEILKSAQAGLLPEFHLNLAKQAIQDFQVPEIIQDLKDQLLSRFQT